MTKLVISMQLTSRQKETLEGVLIKAWNLNKEDIDFLLFHELIYSEWSDYGYKISELGEDLLSEL